VADDFQFTEFLAFFGPESARLEPALHPLITFVRPERKLREVEGSGLPVYGLVALGQLEVREAAERCRRYRDTLGIETFGLDRIVFRYRRGHDLIGRRSIRVPDSGFLRRHG